MNKIGVFNTFGFLFSEIRTSTIKIHLISLITYKHLINLGLSFQKNNTRG